MGERKGGGRERGTGFCFPPSEFYSTHGTLDRISTSVAEFYSLHDDEDSSSTPSLPLIINSPSIYDFRLADQFTPPVDDLDFDFIDSHHEKMTVASGFSSLKNSMLARLKRTSSKDQTGDDQTDAHLESRPFVLGTVDYAQFKRFSISSPRTDDERDWPTTSIYF